MADEPQTRFATTSGGDHVAFQVVGDGPLDVLVARYPLFPIDLMWDEPRIVYFLNRLSSFCRHIWFDPRGMGASERIGAREGRLAETIVEDMVAVMSEVDCERARAAAVGRRWSPLAAWRHAPGVGERAGGCEQLRSVPARG